MKKIIIILLLVTLPLSSFFLVWSKNVIELYFSFNEFSHITPKGSRLHRIGLAEYFSLKNRTSTLLGFSKEAEFNILLQPADLKQLNSNLPLSGSAEKKSYMLVGNNVTKGKLKYRGDNYYHWIYPQKSWRFKTSKNSLFNDVRKVNFIIPKGNALLNNHMSYELARSLGLLSPKSYLTDISVNNIYNGVKIYVEQVDESFLRKYGRMPNDIYQGDNIAQKSHSSVNGSLFNNPGIWEKSSYNNHYEQLSLKPLESMIQGLWEDDYSIYSIEDFAKMAAFIDMIGSYHVDDLHNWMLYYDSYYERMYPIIWDPVGWWPDTVKKDNLNIITSELMRSLYYNYDFLRKKYAVIDKFYSDSDVLFHAKLLDSTTDAKSFIKKNGYTFNMNREYLGEQESYNAVDEFVESVKNKLVKVKQTFLSRVNKKNYKYTVDKSKIRLLLGGSNLVDKVILESEAPLNDLAMAKILITQNGSVIEFDVSNKIKHLTNFSISIDVDLLPGLEEVKIESGKWSKMKFSPVTYDIQLGRFNEKISKISLGVVNQQNEMFSVNQVDFIEQISFQKRFTNIIEVDNGGVSQYWAGVKTFSGFNVVEDDIIISAGTKIIFDEGATLKVLGKVTAMGTQENPITFEAKDKSKPWNAFALKDSKADGSIFKHCIFKDGSGDKGDLYEYTAMFSVHNVKDLLVEDCEFYDSHRTDDMVHVIYSGATFRNTKFVRSLSDALDVDISNVIVDNCEFIDSGNDAIDLMTTNAIVTNTRFLNSKDKGISIGEGSNLLAIKNVIRNSEIGMQSKDTSKAYVYDTSFIGNKKAVDAYHKNWRYSEGGEITLDNSLFEKNIVNATVGKKSKVIINNSTIDTPDNFDVKSVKKGKIVLSHEKVIIPDFNLDFFRNANSLFHEKGRAPL